MSPHRTIKQMPDRGDIPRDTILFKALRSLPREMNIDLNMLLSINYKIAYILLGSNVFMMLAHLIPCHICVRNTIIAWVGKGNKCPCLSCQVLGYTTLTICLYPRKGLTMREQSFSDNHTSPLPSVLQMGDTSTYLLFISCLPTGPHFPGNM